MSGYTHASNSKKPQWQPILVSLILLGCTFGCSRPAEPMDNGNAESPSPALQQASGVGGKPQPSIEDVTGNPESEKTGKVTILEAVQSGKVSIAVPDGNLSHVIPENDSSRLPLPGSTQSGSKQLPALPGSQINANQSLPQLPGASAGNQSSQ